jgi:hypothetical protein
MTDPAMAGAPDLAGLHAEVARLTEQLEGVAAQQRRSLQLLEDIAAESRRSSERWEAADELVRDLTPIARRAMAAATERLSILEERGYGEVLGAGAAVFDRMIRSFDRKGVESVGDNLVLLLKTIQGMR